MDLATGVSSSAFTYTKEGVTTGTTYVFKIQARNVVGYSADSSTVSILAASAPGAPTSLANNSGSTSHTECAFTWSAPIANGSAVLDYKVYWD